MQIDTYIISKTTDVSFMYGNVPGSIIKKRTTTLKTNNMPITYRVKLSIFLSLPRYPREKTIIVTPDINDAAINICMIKSKIIVLYITESS